MGANVARTYEQFQVQGVADWPLEQLSYTSVIEVYVNRDPSYVTPTPEPCVDASDNSEGVIPSNPIAYFNPPTISQWGCVDILHPVSLDLPDMSWTPFILPDAISFSGWRICIDLFSTSVYFAGVEWMGILGTIVGVMAMMGISIVRR